MSKRFFEQGVRNDFSMFKNLNESLERLECEVYSLLKIQQQKCAEIQNLAPSYARIPENLNMVQMRRVKSSGRFDATQRYVKPQVTVQQSSTRALYQSPNYSPEMGSTAYVNYMEEYVQDFSNLRLANNTGSRNRPVKCTNEKCKARKQRILNDKEKTQEANLLIEQLKSEVSTSKNRMAAMAKDMTLLTKGLQTLRTKYKNLKIAQKEALLQIEDFKQLNTELCRKLETEMQKHYASVRNIKERAVNELEIKVKQQASLILTQSHQHHQKLQEANERLGKCTKDFQTKLIDATKEVEQLKSDLEENTRKLEAKSQENETLRMNLYSENNKNLSISKAIDTLENKVRKMIEVERKSNKEVLALKKRITELEKEKQNFSQDNGTKTEECRMLKGECQSMQQKIAELNYQNEMRTKQIEDEMQKLAESMHDKEQKVSKEKNMLRELVQELSAVVKVHKTRINDLAGINKEQEMLLRNQSTVLHSKDQELKVAASENEHLKLKNDDLEHEIQILQKSIEILEHQQQKEVTSKSKVQNLEAELNETRNALAEERDKVLIKDKIINDQAETLSNMRNSARMKANELAKINANLGRLEQQLFAEKTEKDDLLRDVDILNQDKQQLEYQIAHLETDLQKNKEHDENRQQLEQQRKILESLEEQVAQKQEEWELQYQRLKRERDAAVAATKMTSHKLDVTNSELNVQKQREKEIHLAIGEIVREQNAKLKCACIEINQLKKLIKEREESEDRIKNSIKDNVSIASKACVDIIAKIKQIEQSPS
ncbi:hypothetical protein CBL_09040 [Carabus blaptoides fortunei]